MDVGFGYCPPLINSWMIAIISTYRAPNLTLTIDSQWVGAGSNVGFWLWGVCLGWLILTSASALLISGHVLS